MTAAPASSLQGRLERLAAFLPVFAAPGFTFGTLVRPPSTEPGVTVMPYFELTKPAEEFVQVTYAAGWIKSHYDWGEWAQTPEAVALRDVPAVLAQATPDQLEKLLTVLVRQDRFVDGALTGAHESGLLTAILRRAAVLQSGS